MEKMQDITSFEEDQASEDELENDKHTDFMDAAKSLGLLASPQDTDAKV